LIKQSLLQAVGVEAPMAVVLAALVNAEARTDAARNPFAINLSVFFRFSLPGLIPRQGEPLTQ
jgi:hypothetical protein